MTLREAVTCEARKSRVTYRAQERIYRPIAWRRELDPEPRRLRVGQAA